MNDRMPITFCRILRGVTVCYVIVLTILLEMPAAVRAENPVPPARGYEHLITFTLLGVLVELGRRQKSFLFVLILLSVYSVGTEIVQGCLSPICHRTCDTQDLIQDIAGILLGLFAGWGGKQTAGRSSSR
ncbi:MAG: VanZ family protein [Planctomycetaceae bacterium]|jgi:hypothetical protein|nr:VanZ family protein [Planctomycetaceae bacterium]